MNYATIEYEKKTLPSPEIIQKEETHFRLQLVKSCEKICNC